MSTDKRRHPRFSSQIKATLCGSHGARHSCTVLNYSHSGMKLSWPHDTHYDTTSDDLSIEMSLNDHFTVIPIRWVFYRNQSIGIAIREPDEALFKQLKQHAEQYRHQSGLSDKQRSQYRELVITEAKKAAKKILTAWQGAFFDAAFKQANFARNAIEQQQWLSLESTSGRMMPLLEKTYVDCLKEQYARWLSGEAKKEVDPSKHPKTGLSLIEKEDFEAWLMAKVTASHLQSKLSKENFELRQILDSLSTAKTNACFNPLGPNTTTEAFTLGIEKIDLFPNARELAFQSFEHASEPVLRKTYEVLVKEIDIPLTFRYTPKEAPAAPKSETPQSETPPAADSPNAADHSAPSSRSVESPKHSPSTPDGVAHGGSPSNGASSGSSNKAPSAQANNGSAPSGHASNEMFDNFQRHYETAKKSYENIQTLIKHGQQINNDTPPANLSLPEVAHTQLNEIIDELAKQPIIGQGALLSSLDNSASQRKVRLPANSREAIQALETVTDSILSNDDISDAVKPSIEQIGWPLLRLSMRDPSALFNTEHPGRNILNQLGKLGHITNNGEMRVADQLRQAVEPLANMSSINVENMEDALKQVNEIIQSAEHRTQRHMDRIAQTSEGEHTLNKARQRMNRLIGKDISGRTLPLCVVEWLRDGWQPLMSLLLVREGSDSKRFRGAIKLYRQVLMLFDMVNQNRAELLGKFKPIMKLAQQELDQLNGCLPEHQYWFDQILIAADAHLTQGTTNDPVDLPEYEEDVDDILPNSMGLRRAEALDVGDELRQSGSNIVIVVAWIADDRSRFTFVNRNGKKHSELTLQELVDAFNDGLIQLNRDAQTAPVEAGINTLVQNVYQRLLDGLQQDTLTDLPTRQPFIKQVQQVFDNTPENGSLGCLCVIEVDQLSYINKHHGNECGDLFIKTAANHIKQALEENLLARISGDTFGVLLCQYSVKKAMRWCRAIKQAIESEPLTFDGDDVRVLVNIATIELTQKQTDTLQYFDALDSACQQARIQGGERIVNTQIDDAHEDWAKRLDDAHYNERLSLRCVPVHQLQEDGLNVKGHVVTLAIEDEAATSVLDDGDIRKARRRHDNFPYDRWMIRNIIEWLRNHSHEQDAIGRLVLRVSSSTIIDDTLLTFIFEEARMNMVPVNLITFELCDVATIDNLDLLLESMYELRTLGCQFVLTEFGTGSASFDHLKRLPIDGVRIDMHNVQELKAGSVEMAMLRSIQEVADCMNKFTIAEHGFEQKIRDQLKDVGITAYIGDVRYDSKRLNDLIHSS